MKPIRTETRIAAIASVCAGVGFAGLGGYHLLASDKLPWLFSLTLLLLGAVATALALGTLRRHRPSWAFLIATWMVVAFCAFFAAPKVIDLPKVSSATSPEMAARVDAANSRAKRTVLLVCLGFAAPFALLGGGLALGSREYEHAA
ncbi:MAG: hypothetical protein R3B06_16160 [Kofleriaceae bacterium]